MPCFLWTLLDSPTKDNPTGAGGANARFVWNVTNRTKCDRRCACQPPAMLSESSSCDEIRGDAHLSKMSQERIEFGNSGTSDCRGQDVIERCEFRHPVVADHKRITWKPTPESFGKVTRNLRCHLPLKPQQVLCHVSDLEFAVLHVHILKQVKQLCQHRLLLVNLLANRCRRVELLNFRRNVLVLFRHILTSSPVPSLP